MLRGSQVCSALRRLWRLGLRLRRPPPQRWAKGRLASFLVLGLGMVGSGPKGQTQQKSAAFFAPGRAISELPHSPARPQGGQAPNPFPNATYKP